MSSISPMVFSSSSEATAFGVTVALAGLSLVVSSPDLSAKSPASFSIILNLLGSINYQWISLLFLTMPWGIT